MGDVIYTNKYLHGKAAGEGKVRVGDVVRDVVLGADRILKLESLSSETGWSVDRLIQKFVDFGFDSMKGGEDG